MKKVFFLIAVAAFAFYMSSCQKDEIVPNVINGTNGNGNTTRVMTTADLVGTNWTATLSLGDLVYAMTGMTLNDYGCQLPEGFDTNMVYHISFDSQYAHITFSDNISIINVAEASIGEYTMEEIQQMDFAYVYDHATHTGTLTAEGVDEDGNPINYQIPFTYDDNADTITITLQFANAEDENTTITFPLVFLRDGSIA